MLPPDQTFAHLDATGMSLSNSITSLLRNIGRKPRLSTSWTAKTRRRRSRHPRVPPYLGLKRREGCGRRSEQRSTQCAIRSCGQERASGLRGPENLIETSTTRHGKGRNRGDCVCSLPATFLSMKQRREPPNFEICRLFIVWCGGL